MPLGETIVGVATGSGESAIAMVRASGTLCLDLAREALGQEGDIEARRAVLASYRNVEGKVLDEVVFTYFSGDRSYTGEAILEICCHGNPLIVQWILEDLLKRGCRMAEAGEFTRTAFENGKMDLSQAEAVCDLIRARSERGVTAAQRQLRGALSTRVNGYRDDLLQVMAEVEAGIDFPEEDIPEEDLARIGRTLEALLSELEALIALRQYRGVLQEGVKTVIMGAPNAGKSSLLNFLVGEERAIVSDEPGTTRDFIGERIMLGPHCIYVMDTAGFHENGGKIEQQGMAKTLERVEEADLKLWVVDVSEPYPTLPKSVMEVLKPEDTLILENKIDLMMPENGHEDLLPRSKLFKHFKRCSLSLKTQEGTKSMRKTLEGMVSSGIVNLSEEALVVNARHIRALEDAKTALLQGTALLKAEEPGELVGQELREALTHLSEIVGVVDNEAMLDKLFSTFCIGK